MPRLEHEALAAARAREDTAEGKLCISAGAGPTENALF